MKKAKQHNYLKKLIAMRARGKLPITAGLWDLEVALDNWCRIYKGGYCNCDPDIRVRRLFPPPIPEPSVN